MKNKDDMPILIKVALSGILCSLMLILLDTIAGEHPIPKAETVSNILWVIISVLFLVAIVAAMLAMWKE